MNGGDTLEITWNNPNLGSGVAFAKAAEAGTLNPGGVRTNDDMNGIAGSGEAIYSLSQQRWSFEIVMAWNMQSDLTLEKLVALAGDPAESQWTVSNLNGAIYSGSGKPVGDLPGDMLAATFPLKLSGSGKFQKQ